MVRVNRLTPYSDCYRHGLNARGRCSYSGSHDRPGQSSCTEAVSYNHQCIPGYVLARIYCRFDSRFCESGVEH
jgi:hypothetical protein